MLISIETHTTYDFRVRQSSQFSQFMRQLDRLPHVNIIQSKAFRIAEQRVLPAIRVITIPTRNNTDQELSSLA